jgi:positive regulator of sigma E activity
MKEFWNDLKSFITIAMIVLLFIIVIANLFGKTLEDDLFVLVTNLITAVFTYYFAKKSQGGDDDEGFHE